MIEKGNDVVENPEAVLVGLVTADRRVAEVEEYLIELQFHAETAGVSAVKCFIQKLEQPHPKYFVGSGKLAEIGAFVKEKNIDLVIFDDELSPSQLRNIDKQLQLRVLDRTNLILDIFAGRAKTAHAKVQVELAQYQYLLPRLTRMWTHLERQRGGIGLRGPGETEIETDRRIIRDKISRLSEQLKKFDKQKIIQRKNRGKLVRVALVGYTNVGKSTLMNLLSKSDIFAENKLFATLDTTVRKVVFQNLPFLLSDTVGFIRKLPHHLIESFKSTLDEVRESDILVHVADSSHPNFEEQITIVRNTLKELGVGDKPSLLVFNKTDAYTFEQKDADDLTPLKKENVTLEQLQNSWFVRENRPSLFISARERTNIDSLRETLYEMIRDIHTKRYPYNDFLYELQES